MADRASENPGSIDAGNLSDSLLDEETGSGEPATHVHSPGASLFQPPTGISPLVHQTAHTFLHDEGDFAQATFIQAPVQPQMAQPQLHPQFAQQSTLPRQVLPAAPQVPPPQRIVQVQSVPQTPRTQRFQSQLEQKNIQLMQKLQAENQQKMRDMSSQMEQGLKSFLEQSMEKMFTRLVQQAPAQPQVAQPPPPPAPALHIPAFQPTVAAAPPAAPAPEPMDTLTQPKRAPAGKTPVSTPAPQMPPPATTTAPIMSTGAIPKVATQSPLQALESQDYGTDSSSSSFSNPPVVEETEPENLANPPKPEFGLLLNHIREFLGIPDPSTQEEFRLGSGIGRDPNMLRLEQSNKPVSLKLPLQDELARMLRVQNELIQPPNSSPLDIGQFPSPPPNRRNWYPISDEWFSQTPQTVPSSFTNITHAGYKGLPHATVNQRDLGRLEYLTRDNIAILNLLCTFATANESTLNNLRAARDNRERLFDQLRRTTDRAEQDRIFNEMHQSTITDGTQMQFMLDICRSVATAYQHLIPNLLTTLTQLVLTRRDSYLKHVNNSLDACRKKELRTNSVLGQQMFDQGKLQEVEKHLIEMGVRTSSKGRFHPYGRSQGQQQQPKRKSKSRPKGQSGNAYAAQQQYQYPVQPQFVVPQPFFPPPHTGSFRGSGRGRGHRKGRGNASATVSKPPQ